MSKPTSKLQMLQVRNALRPFFNASKEINRYIQFQTIREVVPLDGLQQLHHLIEHNRAYRFPGLGNTFPRDPLKVPDGTLRRLSPLGLSREVSLHVARLNHHVAALTLALTKLADVNDAIRASDWTEAEAGIATCGREHGISLALLRKDLLVSFQTFGLSGLSRRYTQSVEGVQGSAWALLAHITYDLMDSALSPERATRTWLRVLTPRAGRSGYYVNLAMSELLTCWATKSALADAMLRYNATSLVDLALCLWKAIAVRSDWPEAANARQMLRPELLDVLESRFNAAAVIVPTRYFIKGDGPTDLDLFRATYFFQEDAPIARWRSAFMSILYPEAAGQNSLVLGLAAGNTRGDVEGNEDPEFDHVGELVTKIVGSIARPEDKVSSSRFVASVVVADFIRRYDESLELGPERLIRLLAGTSNIQEYVSDATLRKLLGTEHLAKSQLLVFLLHHMLFRRHRSQDNELDRRAAFMRMFSVGGHTEIVPFLNELASWSRPTARYVSTLCTRSFLERLYLLVSSVKEVVETRIAVCDWILAQESMGLETIKEERDALERELANLDARSDLDSTRVHVDEDSLREWYGETQRSQDLRYKQTVLAEGAGSAHGTFLDFYNKTREKPREISKGEDLLADTQIGSEFILLRIFESTLLAFVTDKTFGLDSYLSRRIRHGTLKGFLTTPIARIRRRIDEDIENEERAAERGDLEVVASGLDRWLVLFAERLDYLRREVIQIRSDRHPNGLIEATWNTATNVRHLDAMMARTRARVIESRGDYDIFSDVYLLCWDFLERDLAQLRLRINRDFFREMVADIGALFCSLDYKQKALASGYVGEIHQVLRGRVQEVCGWFIRPVFRRDAYDFQTLVDSTISIVRELDDSYKFREKVEIKSGVSINRGSFDVLGDILFVLIGNAAKHGKKGGLVKVSAEEIDAVEQLIELQVISEMDSPEELKNAAARMKQAASAHDFNLIQSAGVIEGFSGIRKIIGLVNRIKTPKTEFSLEIDLASLSITCRIVAPSIITFARERT